MEGVGPGTVFAGRYSATTRVDEFAGAERWLGTEPELARDISILCLPADDPRAPALLDAARVAAGLEIPTAMRILDIGTEGPLAYVVEESLGDAASVADLVRSGGLPGDEVRRIAGEVATALESARARGVHHLRLAPEEVFRTSEGTIRVRGLATAAALAGVEEGGDRAARTDALGVVALTYAGLTGRWPLEEVPSGLDPAPKAFGGVASPSEIAAGVPRDLDALCRLSLSGRGGPISPGDFARQVAPWSSRPILGARPTTPTTPTTPAAPDPESAAAVTPTPDQAAVRPAPVSPTEVLPLTPGPAGATAAPAGQPTGGVGSDPAPERATEAGVPRPAGAGLPAESSAPPPPSGTSATLAAVAGPSADESGSADSRTEAPHSATTPSAALSAGPGAAVAAGAAGTAGPAGTGTAGAGASVGAAVSGALASAGSALSGLTASLRRLTSQPHPSASSASGASGVTDAPSTARRDAGGAPAPTTPGSSAGPAAVGPAAPGIPNRGVAASSGAASAAASAPATVTREATATTAPARPAQPATLEPPMPGLSAEPLSRNDSRLALGIVATFVVLALILGIRGVSKIGSQTDLEFGSGATAAASATAPPAPAEPQALAVLSADGFDPLGDNSENGQLAPKIFDGNPDTEWVSEGYQTANLGGLKPGAGVVLDLGPNVTPKTVKMVLKLPADVTVLVSSNRSLDGAVTAGQLADANGAVEVAIPADAGPRQYVIIWFTKLSRDGDGFFRARLGEVTVLG